MQIKDFLKLYGAITAFHLAVIYREEEGPMLWLSKALILASLLIFGISKQREGRKSLGPLIGAMAFSWAGDMALTFPQANAFLIGMGCFALAHIFYIGWYLKRGLSLAWIPMLLSLSASLIALLLLLAKAEIPHDLRIPIYIYFGLIALHFTASAVAFAKAKINLYPLLGIALFIISDWWIALSKFGIAFEETWHNRFLIMLSYAAAQALIVLGILVKRD